MVYTVIKGTQSTIGSHLIPSNTSTATIPLSLLDYMSGFADSGGVTVVTLEPGQSEKSVPSYSVCMQRLTNTEESIKQIQQIEYAWTITEYDTWSTYKSGIIITSTCAYDTQITDSDAINNGEWIYNYTTVLIFPVELDGEVNEDDILSLQAYFESLIGATNCSGNAGGIGSVKVGVSMLTVTSTVYTSPQADITSISSLPISTSFTTTASASPAKSPTTTQPNPTPTPTFSSAYRSSTTPNLELTVVPVGENQTQLLSSLSTTTNLAGAIVSAILGIIGFTSTPIITIGTQTYPVSSVSSGLVIAGQTLSTGVNVIVAGQTLSIAPGGVLLLWVARQRGFLQQKRLLSR